MLAQQLAVHGSTHRPLLLDCGRVCRRRLKDYRTKADLELAAIIVGRPKMGWSPAQISRWLRRHWPRRRWWHGRTETIDDSVYQRRAPLGAQQALRTRQTHRRQRGRSEPSNHALRQQEEHQRTTAPVSSQRHQFSRSTAKLTSPGSRSSSWTDLTRYSTTGPPRVAHPVPCAAERGLRKPSGRKNGTALRSDLARLRFVTERSPTQRSTLCSPSPRNKTGTPSNCGQGTAKLLRWSVPNTSRRTGASASTIDGVPGLLICPLGWLWKRRPLWGMDTQARVCGEIIRTISTPMAGRLASLERAGGEITLTIPVPGIPTVVQAQ